MLYTEDLSHFYFLAKKKKKKKLSLCERIYPDHSCCWLVRHHHPVAQSTQVERSD